MTERVHKGPSPVFMWLMVLIALLVLCAGLYLMLVRSGGYATPLANQPSPTAATVDDTSDAAIEKDLNAAVLDEGTADFTDIENDIKNL